METWKHESQEIIAPVAALNLQVEQILNTALGIHGAPLRRLASRLAIDKEEIAAAAAAFDPALAELSDEINRLHQERDKRETRKTDAQQLVAQIRHWHGALDQLVELGDSASPNSQHVIASDPGPSEPIAICEPGGQSTRNWASWVCKEGVPARLSSRTYSRAFIFSSAEGSAALRNWISSRSS